ncbi:MAG: hypothetical protein JW789_04325 [Candidatus Aenigmarchaeota archaeon]|nr:hypothetical protein [Candidatus Aenigmarchaeota archaeon]
MGMRPATVLLILFLVSGCSTVQTPKMTDDVPGFEKIVYEKEGEIIDPDQILPDSMRPGMEWLRENTPSDAVIMSWWDYGHAIRAYAEREPVVDAPSKESLTTTVAKHLGKDPDEIDCPECVDHAMLQEIAELLLTESDAGAVEVMEKYGASYLYVHHDDEEKSVAMFIVLGEDERPLESTVIGKAFTGEPMEGFDFAYEDSACTIYKLSS